MAMLSRIIGLHLAEVVAECFTGILVKPRSAFALALAAADSSNSIIAIQDLLLLQLFSVAQLIVAADSRRLGWLGVLVF